MWPPPHGAAQPGTARPASTRSRWTHRHCVCHNGLVRVRLTLSARRRKIGTGRVIEVMEDAGPPEVLPASEDHDERLLWVGTDHTGLELEVIGITRPRRSGT